MVDAPPATDDHWLPVPRAALLLGLSESTLRRRIRDGHYSTRQEPYKGMEVHVPSAASADGQMEPPLTGDGVQLPSAPVGDGQAAPDLIGQALSALRDLAAGERERSAALEQRASQAEQAAAMWQERSRNLEAENAKLQELLALPAYEEPEPRRRWWQRWRRADG